jgi:hypothetical protein
MTALIILAEHHNALPPHFFYAINTVAELDII